jgi:hypothetical protein
MNLKADALIAKGNGNGGMKSLTSNEMQPIYISFRLVPFSEKEDSNVNSLLQVYVKDGHTVTTINRSQGDVYHPLILVLNNLCS